MKKNCLRLISVMMAFALVFSAAALGFGSLQTGASITAAKAPTAEQGTAAAAVSTVKTVKEAAAILNKKDSPAASSKTSGTANDGCLTACGGDCGHCPTIVIPGIGQSEVYLLDENGKRAVDKDGKDISAWPVIIDTDYLIKTLALPLAKMLITQKDNGFSGLAGDAVAKSLSKSVIGLDTHPVSSLEVVKYPQSVARCSESDKNDIYNHIPLQTYTSIVGEDHLYYLAYNSFGNNMDIAKELYDMIQLAKKETGHDKVNLVPISLGGTIANTLFELYPDVYDDINRVIYIVPAVDGSALLGDIMKGNLNTSDEMLYRDLFPSLMDDSYSSYLLNAAIRIIPKQVLLDTLNQVISALRKTILVNCTMMWGLVPSADYPALSKELLSDDAHAEVKRQTDIYYRAQIHSKANILKLIAGGVKVFDVVDYNVPIYSFVPCCTKYNADGIIDLNSTSMGATSGLVNTPLPAGYVQKNTFCANPAHNHISPNRIVDASTGLLPDTTFYFCNQSHEGTARNDVIIKLATELLANNNFTDVYTMPERFPQFNAGRESRGFISGLLKDAKAVDQSALSAADAAELQASIARADKMIANTIVDYDEYTAAQTQLRNIMIKIGKEEAPKDDTSTKNTAAFCKFISDALYKYWGPRGFSDRRIK